MGSAAVTKTEMTVRELCAEWLSVSSHRVKLSTVANYHMKIEKHIIPEPNHIVRTAQKSPYDKLN